jgi:hypothetical protein
VRSRHLGDRVLHAGVFGSLPAGPYDLRLQPSSSAPMPSASTPAETIITVTVKEGTVVETALA